MAEDALSESDIEFGQPVDARVHDHLLGGSYSWETDQLFGDRVLKAFPLVRSIARANRLFLHRVVRQLIRNGIRQFVDLGTGLPTLGQVHEVAELAAPGEIAVVYVDQEPVTVAHARVQLDKTGDLRRHAAVRGDLTAPDRLWEQVAGTGVLDVDTPVGLLFVSVLHLQPDDVVRQTVARYRELASPRSYLAISHLTDEDVPAHVREGMQRYQQLYATIGTHTTWRCRAELAALVDGMELVEPGLTWVPQWHPEEAAASSPAVEFSSPNESAALACVARTR